MRYTIVLYTFKHILMTSQLFHHTFKEFSVFITVLKNDHIYPLTLWCSVGLTFCHEHIPGTHFAAGLT